MLVVNLVLWGTTKVGLGILVEQKECGDGLVFLDERWCSLFGGECPKPQGAWYLRCEKIDRKLCCGNPFLSRDRFGWSRWLLPNATMVRMRALHTSRWTSACWIWFALSIIRCWVEFMILGNLSSSSRVETIICTSLKMRANSGKFSMDITALGCRV